ncbi:MAG: DUF3999 family protein, partial [Methylococcales bacterium]|nr:DUF3999 family protein [Methylococcales bacterium]
HTAFTFLLLIASSLQIGLAADFDPAPFAFQKEAKVKLGEEGIAAFSLDSEIFENVRNNYANLRLVRIKKDGKLAEVPFLKEIFTHPKIDNHSQLIQTEEISLKETDNNTVEITVKLRDEEKAAARLVFDTPLIDFERRVSISGSSDGITWKAIVKGGRIFDYTRFLDIRRTEISLPKNDHRYFKVLIDQAVDDKNSPLRQISRSIKNGEEVARQITSKTTTRPFRMDHLKWFTEHGAKTLQKKDEITYPAPEIEVSENADKKETNIYLSTQKQPLMHFTLVTDSKNFRRRVSVQVSDPAENWRPLQTAHLFRYDIGDFQEERLTVSFPETRSEEYRIVIKNDDNPSLTINKIEAEGPNYRLLCLAEPNDELRVYFGGDKAHQLRPPVYDTSAI